MRTYPENCCTGSDDQGAMRPVWISSLEEDFDEDDETDMAECRQETRWVPKLVRCQTLAASGDYLCPRHQALRTYIIDVSHEIDSDALPHGYQEALNFGTMAKLAILRGHPLAAQSHADAAASAALDVLGRLIPKSVLRGDYARSLASKNLATA